MQQNQSRQSTQGTGKELERSGSRSMYRGSTDPYWGGMFSSNPFSLMRQMQSEMDRLFSQAFGGMGAGFGGSTGMAGWTPAIEVTERDGNLKICAELPGMKPEEVKVELANDQLVIEGERRSEQESGEGGYRRSERHYGKFYRSIPLPEGVDPDQARAQFNNGVLEVTVPLPASAQSKRRQIPIK